MANGTLNQTINETVNATMQAVDLGTASSIFFTVLIPELLRRLFIFLAAPFLYPEMWWLLVHLLLTFVLFEFYFERHHEEDLGWSAALANSIVLVFIAMELLRSLYDHAGTPFSVLWQVVLDLLAHGPFAERTVIIGLVVLLGAFGLVTAVINYFHTLPRSIAFLISGHRTVNLLAYFLIVVVWRYTHGEPLALDWITGVALILFGTLLWSVLFMLNRHLARRRRERQTQWLPF